MDKDFYLKRWKKLVVVKGRTGESLGLGRRGRKLHEGKVRDMDWYRENGVKGLVERRDKGLEGHSIFIAWDWKEGDLYLMSREKTSIVVEGKAQSCDCRVREENCVTLALQSEIWGKERSPGSEIQNC